MDQTLHSSLVGFIWNIADDVLRDYYVRGKYRDVILPMTVLPRLDALLEDTKQAVLNMYERILSKYLSTAASLKVSPYRDNKKGTTCV